MSTISSTHAMENDAKPPTYGNVQYLPMGMDQSPSPSHVQTPTKKVGLKTITFLFASAFFPLIAFSVVILWIVFHYRVTPSKFASLSGMQLKANEDETEYYYVNFSATRILFVASWSSTVAPMLVGAIMTLSLFPISRKLFQISRSENTSRLPTPYQLAILLGLSDGNKMAMWNFLRYTLRGKRAPQSTGLKISALIYVLAVVLSTLIVIIDTVLHITTETISIYETTAVTAPNITFSKGTNAACANWTLSEQDSDGNPPSWPCTVEASGHAPGLIYPDEVYKTLSNNSLENQVLQVPTGNSTAGDLFLLGPAANQRAPNSDFRASTVGVSTSCEAISQLCNLQAPIGASTPFDCSSNFAGNLQAPYYNSTALVHGGTYDSTAGSYVNYTSGHNNFGLAVFQDHNLTVPYSIIGYHVGLNHKTPNPFYMGLGGIANPSTDLYKDPETVEPVHGGVSFILRCEVNTYDVTYAYVNDTISPDSISKTLNNGTVGWNFLAPASYQQERLSQMLDLSAIQNTSSDLALSYSNTFSSFAVAMLAGAYDGRPVLEQQVRNELLVAKILKSAIWLLVLFNMIFALGGAAMAVWAWLVAVTGSGDAHALFSVEEVVGMCFEKETFGGRGGVEERFEEQRVGELSGRVGVERKEDGWALRRVNVRS